LLGHFIDQKNISMCICQIEERFIFLLSLFNIGTISQYDL